jgi:hypothetical protein
MVTRQFLSIFFSAVIFLHPITPLQWFVLACGKSFGGVNSPKILSRRLAFCLVFAALYFRAFAASERTSSAKLPAAPVSSPTKHFSGSPEKEQTSPILPANRNSIDALLEEGQMHIVPIGNGSGHKEAGR